MDTKKNIIKKLSKFKEDIVNNFPVKKIVFFGSRAFGKSNEDSDIDLIIVSQNFENLDFFKRGAKMYSYWSLDYPVDFLCYTPDEFKKKKKQIGIVRDAVKKGIEIK